MDLVEAVGGQNKHSNSRRSYTSDKPNRTFEGASEVLTTDMATRHIVRKVNCLLMKKKDSGIKAKQKFSFAEFQ